MHPWPRTVAKQEAGKHYNDNKGNQISFFEQNFEIFSKQEIKILLKKVLRFVQIGHLDSMIYQALTTGKILLNGGGVFDYNDTEFMHPIRLMLPIRKLIYLWIFPRLSTGPNSHDQGQEEIRLIEIYPNGVNYDNDMNDHDMESVNDFNFNEKNNDDILSSTLYNPVCINPCNDAETIKNILRVNRESIRKDRSDPKNPNCNKDAFNFLDLLNSSLSWNCNPNKLNERFRSIYYYEHDSCRNWGMPLILLYLKKKCSDFYRKLSRIEIRALIKTSVDKDFNNNTPNDDFWGFGIVFLDSDFLYF